VGGGGELHRFTADPHPGLHSVLYSDCCTIVGEMCYPECVCLQVNCIGLKVGPCFVLTIIVSPMISLRVCCYVSCIEHHVY